AAAIAARGVAGAGAVADRERTSKVEDAPAATVGGVVGHGTVADRQHTFVEDAAAGEVGGSAPDGGNTVGNGQAVQRGRHPRIDREDRGGSAAVNRHRTDAQVV